MGWDDGMGGMGGVGVGVRVGSWWSSFFGKVLDRGIIFVASVVEWNAVG